MRRIAAAVVGAILCAGVAAAQTPKPAPRGGDDLKAEQRRLQETQRQLNEERAKAAAAAKRETSLLAELETIDKSLLEKKGEVTRLDARVNKAEAELGALRGDIGRLAGRRSEQEEQLFRRLRALYKVQADHVGYRDQRFSASVNNFGKLKASFVGWSMLPMLPGLGRPSDPGISCHLRPPRRPQAPRGSPPSRAGHPPCRRPSRASRSRS